MKLNGLNILPRNGVDLGATIEYHRVVQPSVSLVFLEPAWVEPLRKVSPNTLYIFRTWPDDHVYDIFPNPVEFVDMLHNISPAGCALYLGNEPGDMDRLVAWTLPALDRCDQLGRIGVAANLPYGWPEVNAWDGVLKPLLKRIAGTHHVIGLHEYWHNKDLGLGFWVDRVRHLFAAAQRQGLPAPRVAITELGATNNGDPHAGWLKAGLTSWEYLGLLIRIFDEVYSKYPTLLGANIFSWGGWNGFEIHQDTTIIEGLKAWRPKTMAELKRIVFIGKVQNLSGAWNVRVGVGTNFIPVGTLQNDDIVEVQIGAGFSDGYNWARVKSLGNPVEGYVALLDKPEYGMMSKHFLQVFPDSHPPIQDLITKEDLDFMISRLSAWSSSLF